LALTHRMQAVSSQRQETGTTRKHLALGTRALLAGFAALSLAVLLGVSGTAHAATGLTYRYGLSVQNGWLCRGWANGAYHCTQHWYRDRNGNLVSLNQAWVPTGAGSGAATTQRATGGTQTSAVTHTAPVTYSGGSGVGLATEPCSPYVPSSVWTAVNYRQPGAIPPGCYGGVYSINPSRYVYRPYFGVCNWWPEVLRPDEPGIPYSTSYPRHSAPRAGATVVYAPFDHGASSGGHYGHVEAVSPDGRWILTSEMNFYWRGGGFGKVIYRYVNVDAGMSFIY